MDNKQALNMYGVLDNELDRMHKLLHIFLSLPVDSKNTHAAHASKTGNVPIIFQRILAIQDLVIKAAVSVDPAVQEKIAELALTGEAKK